MPSQPTEDPGHKKLRLAIAGIFERAGFIVDTRVQLDLDGDGASDHEMDVCAFTPEGHEKVMIEVECKNVAGMGGIQTDITSWNHDYRTITRPGQQISVLSSDKSKIESRHFRGLNEFKKCYAFTEKITSGSLANAKAKFSNAGILTWDADAVKYFEKVSEALEFPVRYEIFREFKIISQTLQPVELDAVQIKQDGHPYMYLLGMQPSLLLRIGYVVRRISKKTTAYQRAITNERIKKISEFFRKKRFLLPNSIIIAFDRDTDTQNSISYNQNTGHLRFPLKYCSAWIIDGQHRVYGFGRIKEYLKWPNHANNLKLPVVAFRYLDEIAQNKTFVDINYNQKKIDPTLFCDLATETKDLGNELTWPSLLAVELNKTHPWNKQIKVGEYDKNTSISLSSFARYSLLEVLLGFNKKAGTYRGPLYRAAPFDDTLSFQSSTNQAAFHLQISLLKKFFTALHTTLAPAYQGTDRWHDFQNFGITKTTGVNSMLLVLSKLLEVDPTLQTNLNTYLAPLAGIDYRNDHIARFGGGWTGFRNFANYLIGKLNRSGGLRLARFPRRKKK